MDIDKKKIAKIRRGEIPIYEPGLKELVSKNIKNSRLSFTTNLAEAVKESEIIFICVGTPSNQNGATDLNAVWTVAKEIAGAMNNYKVIVVKSTVPVGTNEKAIPLKIQIKLTG